MSNDEAKALRSLEGLSIGDAFGELFFTISPHHTSPATLPKTTWRWTDDTHMALSIVEVLKTYGHIEQDALARAFARRYQEEPYRGYGGGAARLLQQVAAGSDWRTISPLLFGSGSYGNGAAMRVAPLGGFFPSVGERCTYLFRVNGSVFFPGSVPENIPPLITPEPVSPLNTTLLPAALPSMIARGFSRVLNFGRKTAR